VTSPDTWHARELPILRLLVAEFEAGAWRVEARSIAEKLDFTSDRVELALRYLESDGLVEQPPRESRRASGVQIQRVTAAGLRRAGAWPTEQTALDRMLASLEAIAANTEAPDDDRSRARRILSELTGDGRNLGLAVVTAIVTGQVT
jgi:DNA-binding PadR family transcriptional regulator